MFCAFTMSMIDDRRSNALMFMYRPLKYDSRIQHELILSGKQWKEYFTMFPLRLSADLIFVNGHEMNSPMMTKF